MQPLGLGSLLLQKQPEASASKQLVSTVQEAQADHQVHTHTQLLGQLRVAGASGISKGGEWGSGTRLLCTPTTLCTNPVKASAELLQGSASLGPDFLKRQEH